ncbi:kunitz-type serine protease inhibitor conotoxin Cal9.1a-like [Achroia grisella]|uniref:kunitz-type serine protease inhibitor conotoxin Cal9.1a-like n=1 Tax=Achroia grisella TaxID=688607 RepID=UPI0027D2E0F1|nr:kunitz-type serine protease inhibitor conotoxin Cal9.1a-like [Achroia grisella]
MCELTPQFRVDYQCNTMNIFVILFCLISLFHLDYGQQVTKDCNAPIDAQICFGITGYYAYDVTINKCIPLKFAGCYDAPNEFQSKEECEKTCVRKQQIKNEIF